MTRLFHLVLPWTTCLIVSLGVAGFCYADTNLICCGTNEVFIINPGAPSKKKWTWCAEDSPSIPKDFQAKFRSTDDCKPYEGEQILITSSSGGVALIQRSTKKCLFLAECRNAHSACLLPRNRIATAASYGGDQIEFYDLADDRRPAVAEQTIPLTGAHGVVWDERRSCLWALGGNELLRLSIDDEKAAPDIRWSVKSRHELPSAGGHDLSPARDGNRLIVTTNTQVLLFDRDRMSYETHAKLGDQSKIKSVDVHPVTKRVVFHMAGQENWWSDTVRLLGGESLRLEGERLYKVRWDVPSKRF